MLPPVGMLTSGGRASTEEPYINHLLEVAMLVAEATEGRRPDLVVAALLHDAIEDQEVPRRMIAASFGENIASLVAELTDDTTQAKDVRKRHQVETAPYKSADAKIIKLADKTSNLRAIAASPPADWSVQRRLDYIDWARQVVAGLKGASPPLKSDSTRRQSRPKFPSIRKPECPLAICCDPPGNQPLDRRSKSVRRGQTERGMAERGHRQS